jgi:hypothetical protein
MKTNNRNQYDPRHDAESRKKGPFSIFIMSYELPPIPAGFANKHPRHQMRMEDQKDKKANAREWHKNPNRRRSTPMNVLV